MEKAWQRTGVTNHHHLRPRSRGGDSLDSNLLLIDTGKHDAWHFIFGNLTLDEIIKILIMLRMVKERRQRHKQKQMKAVSQYSRKREQINQDLVKNILAIETVRHGAWCLLFKDKVIDEVIKLLSRLKSLKKNQRRREKIN